MAKAKKNFQDILPPARSIRNVEIPSRRAIPSPVMPSRSEAVKESVKTEPVRIVPKKPVPVAPEYIATAYEIQTPPPARPIQQAPLPPREPVKNDFTPRSTFEKSIPIHSRETMPPVSDTPSYAYTYDAEPPRNSRKILYVSIFFFVVALAFGVSALFKSAKITLTPRHETRAISGVFTAQKDGTQNTLGFQVVTVTKDVETKVDATGQQNVSTKAQGTIVIYNNESATPQKLIATTRFQTAAGLVYRLINPVTVPGRQTVGGKVVAGSVDAQVTADAPGDAYNIPLSDFTLPAFKGDPKFKTIYARSKTPMTGGFSGMQKIVSPAALSAADATLEAQLRDSLAKDIVSQIPANFIMYPADISYSFTQASETSSGSTDSSALLQKKGTAEAIIFDKALLSQVIVSKILPEVSADSVKVANLDQLVFAFATSTASSTPSHAQSISFSLNGSGNFVWILDENKIKTSLLGLSKTAARTALSTNPAIQEVWIETRPFWNQTIPADTTKVSITNSLGE